MCVLFCFFHLGLAAIGRRPILLGQFTIVKADAERRSTLHTFLPR